MNKLLKITDLEIDLETIKSNYVNSIKQYIDISSKAIIENNEEITKIEVIYVDNDIYLDLFFNKDVGEFDFKDFIKDEVLEVDRNFLFDTINNVDRNFLFNIIDNDDDYSCIEINNPQKDLFKEVNDIIENLKEIPLIYKPIFGENEEKVIVQ